MKQVYMLFILFFLAIFALGKPSFAATVGNPLDLDLPARSALLRKEAIDKTLDEYEQAIKIKAGLDVEIVLDRDLNTPTEVVNAEMEGMWYMAKFGLTLFNRVEPYIKLGTSNLQVKWRQDLDDIEVDADYGLAWGAGVKGVIWEFEDWGIRLTGDAQYRTTEPDVEEISRRGGNVNVADPGANFELEEWQAALVLSKKIEIPLRWQSVYLVPYTGAIVSDATVDVKFSDPTLPGTDYSLFDANNSKMYGFLIGCDIMPSLASSFIYSIEARFVNEFALTLGGTVQF